MFEVRKNEKWFNSCQDRTRHKNPAYLTLGAIGAVVLCLAACSDNTDLDTNEPDAEEVTQASNELDQMLSSFYQADNVVNTMITVNDGTQTGSFGLARGVAKPATSESMTADHQFHLASMTKPFTVAVLLQLIEEGLFSLDKKLNEVFSDTSLDQLCPQYSFTMQNPSGVNVANMSIKDLHQFSGVSQGQNITLRQLAQHSHGMPDLTFDAPSGGQSLVDLTIQGAVGVPGVPAPRQWSAMSLLEYYLSSGLPSQSLFVPGDGYHYGDTGLLVAALVIEKSTGMSLVENYRTRIFDPLGMNDTYLMHYEEPRNSASPGLSHRHYDLSGVDPSLSNIDVDEAGWNTSFDFAGGGLVSTAADIDKFFRALFANELGVDSSQIGDVSNRVPGDERDPVYGLGFSLNIDPETGAVLSYDHGGAWGSYMAFFPHSETSAVFTANQVVFDSYAQLVTKLRSLF